MIIPVRLTALGPLAYDTLVDASKHDSDYKDEKGFASTVLTLAVLAILVTAPIGSAVIMLTHPILLSKEGEELHQQEDPENEAKDEDSPTA